MAQLSTTYQPGSTATTTPGVASSNDGALEAFIAKRMAEYEEARQRQLAGAQQQYRAPGAMGARRAPAQAAVAPGNNEQGAELHGMSMALQRAALQDARDEMAYKAKLRAIDLNPPKQLIDSRPGIIGGWAYDSSALPVSMRPGSASFQGTETDEDRLRTGRNAAFQSQLQADRARGRTRGY